MSFLFDPDIKKLLARLTETAVQNPENQDIQSKARQWRNTRRLIKRGFRVELCRSNYRHSHGGPSRHSKARCFTCRKPLRLVWSIDLADKRLPAVLIEVFAGLTHLPLYYCFNCPEATTYRMLDDTTLKCMDPDGADGGDETPYTCETEVPAELPVRPLRLTPIPFEIDGLRLLADEIGWDSLDAKSRKLVSSFVGRKVPDISQFGGQLTLLQGHHDIDCPNPRCPSAKLPDRPEFQMKELAVIESDGITGFNWVYAPLEFHACWVCGTIQGNFGCT